MRRCEGPTFKESEEWPTERAGQAFRLKGAVVHVKRDGVELCERFGLPSRASAVRLCFCCCVANDDEMHNPTGISVMGAPWHANTKGDFEAACATCEVRVVLNQDFHRLVGERLAYDRRPNGARGPALTKAVT